MSDVITDSTSTDTDVVKTSLDYRFASNIEQVEATGVFDISISGGSTNNLLKGNVAANQLYGGDGSDTLYGGGGNDSLHGDWGSDTMYGGAGDDSYYFAENEKQYDTGWIDVAIEQAGEGIDTIYSDAYDNTLPDNVENLVLGYIRYERVRQSGNVILEYIARRAIGNSGNNIIDARNTEIGVMPRKCKFYIDGGAGADTMYGGGASDTTYIVDNLSDVVIEASGVSTDTVISSVSYTLGSNIENITLSGSAADSATGNEINNILDGSQNRSANVLAGMKGDDTYIIGVGDTVIESVDGGNDTVVLTVERVLGNAVRVSDYANVENAKLDYAQYTTLYGDDGGNILWGGYYSDTINGGAGNDVIYDGYISGSSGNDLLIGGSGNDVIYSKDGVDTLIGGTGDDTLSGYTQAYSYFNFSRGDGSDVIVSYSKGTVVFGENIALNDLDISRVNDDLQIKIKNTSDQIVVQNQFKIDNNGVHWSRIGLQFADGNVVPERLLNAIAQNGGTPSDLADDLAGGSGNDSINGLDGNDVIYGLLGNDTLIGGLGNDTLLGAEGDDSMDGGDGNDSLEGGAGDNRMNGGAGNDRLEGGSGNEIIDGGDGSDTILGFEGNDLIIGGIGDDYLTGQDGDDTLIGGIGNDSMTGNLGRDVYRFDVGFGQDTIRGTPQGADEPGVGDWIEFGAGIYKDNLLFTRSNPYGDDWDLTISVKGTSDSIVFYEYKQDLLGIRFIDNTTMTVADVNALFGIQGTNGNDSLVGDANNNEMYGLAGNDTLNGGDGNDVLDGGLGIDSLIGGNGNDCYLVDSTSDTVTESSGGGNDTVKASVDYTLSNNVETLELIGLSALNGNGNASANYLKGNAGNNILDGKAGADTMDGGEGSDIYYVDTVSDVIYDSSTAYEDIDTVISSVTYTLQNSIDNLTLTGSNAINGTGNDLGNVLRGNSGANVLKGGGGSDTYYVSAGDSVVENLETGQDRVYSDVTFTLGSNIEELYLTGSSNINGTGNSSFNYLYGNAGDNILDGKGDDDWMEGGAGNDTYIQDSEGDAAIEEIMREALDPLTGETFYYWADVGGIDTVKSSANVGGVNEDDGTLWGLGNYVENLELTGTTAQLGYGNDIANNILGNSAANMLRGFEGNDTLNGAGGADTMFGGVGDDTYVVDVAGDVVTENAGEGTDLVQSGVTYSLASLAEIENLTLTGTNTINATGNAKDNILIGNSANNTLTGGAGNDRLDGGAGNDTMVGGTGNDTYVVNVSTDVVTENANEGTDTVESNITYSIASLANLENLTLTGTSAINATGNAAANVLTGNSAANTLDGGAGNDTLIGGAGNDTYVVDSLNDVITENANEGTDLVNASATFSLAAFANVENLTLTGTGAINATGNALANTLTGNSGNNVLDGGAGNDTLVGGAGNDTYIVDSLSDVVTEAASAGTDTVKANLTYTLASLTNVENLTLTGTGAINATGNTLANVLTGNSGNNRIDGGTGNDTMIGGAGNDTYVFNVATDVVTENANEGIDTIETGVTLSIASVANVENITLTGTSAINATGNTLDNVLLGNSANNTLTGGAGNDRLDGGAGNDTMVGGTGNDTYVVNVSTDVVTENAGEGTDTVESSITYSIASLANLENITLTGSTAINATGNGSANALIGNSGINTLTGGAGNDTLDGAAGNDSLVGGTGNDTYVLGRGYGADSVTENDSTAGNTDVASFMAGIATDQIWFRKINTNDLEVSVIGTSDKLTLTSWYLGNQYHVEQFKTADGKLLLDTDVQKLVDAMAAFAPPAAGQTTLPSNYQSTLNPVLAANWH